MSLPFLVHKLSRKKAETFFPDQSQSRAKIQTMARKHTHYDQVQNFVRHRFRLQGIQVRHKQDWGRGFILLLPQTAALRIRCWQWCY